MAGYIPPQGAEVLTPPPLLQLTTHGVQPPSALLVGVNDQLTVSVAGSIFNFTTSIFVKLLLADGSISIMQRDVTVGANRTVITQTLPLQDGFILSVAFANPNQNIGRGACFCRATLIRGINTPQIVHQVLISGYLDQYNFPSWPSGTQENSRSGQGNIRAIVGSPPAAGAEISETIPPFAVWRILSFRYSLVTSATVANRISHFLLADGAAIAMNCSPAAAVTAGQTVGFNWAAGMNSSLGDSNMVGPIPFQYVMTQGWILKTLTTGIQVGDQYTAPSYLVEEWIGQ